VWVDGSLRDHDWFAKYFADIRSRYRHYRLAIFHITAEENIIRRRLRERGEQTGRVIPEADIAASLADPEASVRRLAPACDLVVRFRNDGPDAPRLLSVEDHSGNLQRGLYRHFGVITSQALPFPQGLGPLFFESTAMVGEPFTRLRTGEGEGEGGEGPPWYPDFEGRLLVKVS
jgi:hypothetical protein